MKFNLKKLTYSQALIFLAIAAVIVGTLKLYSSSVDNLYASALEKHQKQVQLTIKNIFRDHRGNALSIALALAENPNLQNFLCEDCDPTKQSPLDFTHLISRLGLLTQNGKIWIQVIDRKGISRYRSWTNRVGDSLREVRYDVRQMINSHSVMHSMSVGRFSLTSKAMAPVFDENQKLLGMVELITHMEPLVNSLHSSRGIDSVVLVDQRFQNQLTRADERRFMKGFYIANENAKEENVSLLRAMTAEQISEFKPYQKVGDQVITQFIVEDSVGRLMGYWYTFTDKSMVDMSEIRLLNKQYLYATIIVTVLSLLLLWIYWLQRQTSADKTYFSNILNATTEIILVSDKEKIVDANTRFFEFYSEFTSIKQFLQHYNCVCDTFEPGEDLLQPYMEDQYWLDYVIEHPEKQHLAKIKRDGEEHYFQIGISQVQDSEHPLFSIIMHDVTKQTLYKKQLEKQAKTDPLTEIGNRLQFNKRLTEEIARAHRYKHPLCLLTFDIDHFKSINDSFGHDAGNQVLITISHLVRNQLREADVFCRIGGEEFAIIMPETEKVEAKLVAERIRIAIYSLEEHQVPRKISVSLGVAEIERLDSDVTLFKKADTALYAAKGAGRNQVVIHDQTISKFE